MPAREKCLCACAVGTKLMAGEIHMSAVHPVRKPCPVCRKAMKRVRHETKDRRDFYVCPRCDKDPLHDATAQKWASSPLKRPTET